MHVWNNACKRTAFTSNYSRLQNIHSDAVSVVFIAGVCDRILVISVKNWIILRNYFLLTIRQSVMTIYFREKATVKQNDFYPSCEMKDSCSTLKAVFSFVRKLFCGFCWYVQVWCFSCLWGVVVYQAAQQSKQNLDPSDNNVGIDYLFDLATVFL